MTEERERENPIFWRELTLGLLESTLKDMEGLRVLPAGNLARAIAAWSNIDEHDVSFRYTEDEDEPSCFSLRAKPSSPLIKHLSDIRIAGSRSFKVFDDKGYNTLHDLGISVDFVLL